jgi:hypothetical protein
MFSDLTNILAIEMLSETWHSRKASLLCTPSDVPLARTFRAVPMSRLKRAIVRAVVSRFRDSSDLVMSFFM